MKRKIHLLTDKEAKSVTIGTDKSYPICTTTCANGTKASCVPEGKECGGNAIINNVVIGAICDNQVYTCTGVPDQSFGTIIDLDTFMGSGGNIESGTDINSGTSGSGSGADSGSGGSGLSVATNSIDACQGKHNMAECYWVDGNGSENHGRCQLIYGSNTLYCQVNKRRKL